MARSEFRKIGKLAGRSKALPHSKPDLRRINPMANKIFKIEYCDIREQEKQGQSAPLYSKLVIGESEYQAADKLCNENLYANVQNIIER